jgi:predicted DNA-binding ribbon-helix-helix protein
VPQVPDLAVGGAADSRAPADPPHKRRKHSVLIAGHRTSLSIEEAFWEQLKAIAARRRISLNKLIAEIDRSRGGTPGKPTNLSSSIRVFILEHLTGVR